MPIEILVDADACPVKAEIFRVAERHGASVKVVANSPLLLPRDAFIERIVVAAGPDAADDWIAARASPESIVITADIPLAARALAVGAQVLAHNGKPFTPDSIGMALAMRNLMQDLRAGGEVTGGPKPFAPKDRSAFLSALDATLVRLKRAALRPPD